MRNNFIKAIVIIFTLTVCLLSVTGCKPGPLMVTEKDNGKDITLEAGRHLSIELPANPSTGYSWEVKATDASILEQVGFPQFVSENVNLVGAGGKLTLTFDTLKSGSTALELVYHRPWETNVAPLQTFIIQVTVK